MIILNSGEHRVSDMIITLKLKDTKDRKRAIVSALKKRGLIENKDFEFPKKGWCNLFVDVEDYTSDEQKLFNKVEIKTNRDKFEIFVYSLFLDSYFNTMPWVEKVNYLNEKYGISVSVDTLRRWRNKLIENNIIKEDECNFSWWCSRRNDKNELYRYMVEKDDKELLEWKKFIKEEYNIDVDEEDATADIFRKAWGEFNRVYKKYWGYYVTLEERANVEQMVNRVEKRIKNMSNGS